MRTPAAQVVSRTDTRCPACVRCLRQLGTNQGSTVAAAVRAARVRSSSTPGPPSASVNITLSR